MATISEKEFERICDGIRVDREKIILNNPIGTDTEVLLWMLLGVLVSFLNLSEVETPCFTGRPDEKTYRDAINFVLANRKAEDFEVEKYIEIALT